MAGSKTVAVVGAAVVVAAGAWVGAGVMAGLKAEEALKALQTAPHKPGTSWRVTQLKHERGLLSSKGDAEVTFTPGCDSAPGDDQTLKVRLTYSLNHLPLPTGAARFDWQATPTGEAADAFKELFGSATALTGHGAVGLSGAIQTDMNLPEVAMRRSGQSLQIPASMGHLSIKDKALGFGWKMEKLVARGSGEAFELKDVLIDVDLDNRHLGTGSTRLAIGHASTGVGTMEGFELKSRASDNAGRLDMTVTPSVKKIEARGQVLSDLALEMALKGLDTQSVATMSAIFEASCGLEALTADEGKRLGDAINTILTKGFSMGIQTLKAKVADGSLDGELMVELKAAKGGKVSLEQQLKSNGRLDLAGKALTDEQRKMAIGMGVAVQQGDGLRASFEYADGLLKVNGRAMDASNLQAGLRSADQALEMAISTMTARLAAPKAPAPAPVLEEPKEEVVSQAPVQAPPVEAPAAPAVVAPAPAPAPAPAATQDCDNLAACVAQTLAAAKAEDVDGVRKVAGRIDAMPKPELGNKAVARQMNTAALEAFKREDYAVAAQQFRNAVKENPRDVEIAANLGFALVKAGRGAEAQEALVQALTLDPRRTSTWAPLAEALALQGKADDARAAMWVAFQWSSNRDKSLAYYQDRAGKETNPQLLALYTHMAKVAAASLAAPAR